MSVKTQIVVFRFLVLYCCRATPNFRNAKHIEEGIKVALITGSFVQHFIFQVMHTTLKVELLKHFKIRKLLQHVSVYKETIIREPQPVIS